MWIYVNWIEFRMLYNTVELLDIADLCHTPSSLRPRWCRLLLLRRHEGAKMISAVTPMAHSAHSAHSDPIAISCHHGLVTVLSRQVGTATTRISRLLRLRVQLCRTSLWSYLVKIWWVVEYCCCCCFCCCCCCCRHWGATFMLQVHSYIHMAQTITDNASSDVSCAGQTTPLILVFGDWCDWCDCEVSGVQTEQVLHHRHVIDSHGQEVCALNRFRFQDRTLRLVSWVAETKCVLVANLAGESYAGVLWFAILDMIQTFAGRRFSHCNMAAFLHTNTCWLTRAGLYSNTHQRNPGTCTWDQNASWHLCGILWKCIFLSDFWCDLPLFHLQILPRTGASSETEGEQKVFKRKQEKALEVLAQCVGCVAYFGVTLSYLCRTFLGVFWSEKSDWGIGVGDPCTDWPSQHESMDMCLAWKLSSHRVMESVALESHDLSRGFGMHTNMASSRMQTLTSSGTIAPWGSECECEFIFPFYPLHVWSVRSVRSVRSGWSLVRSWLVLARQPSFLAQGFWRRENGMWMSSLQGTAAPRLDA